MTERLQGKVALVSGGARGIGEGIVRRFIAEGARVVIADILVEEGQALAAELGDVALFVTLDVTSRAQWDAAVTQTVARFGGLDCLVNNAGVIIFKTIDDLSEAEIRRILDINVLGVMLGTQAAIAALEKDGGSIINMSSADGISGANALSAYCASKFAVRGFTKSCALELGPRGIRVNSIHPGGVDTTMGNPQGQTGEERNWSYGRVPLQRIGEPEEIAAASLFLCSDEASYVNGAELAVDGGWAAGYYHPYLPAAPASLKA